MSSARNLGLAWRKDRRSFFSPRIHFDCSSSNVNAILNRGKCAWVEKKVGSRVMFTGNTFHSRCTTWSGIRQRNISRFWENSFWNSFRGKRKIWRKIGSKLARCVKCRCKSKSVRVNLCVYTCTSCLSVVNKLEFRFNCVTCNGKNVKEYKIVIRLQWPWKKTLKPNNNRV